MTSPFIVLIVLLAAVGLVAAVADRLRAPPPLLFILAGLAVSLTPGLPEVHLDPALILSGFLPPLLYADAFETSWRDFQRWLRPILMLAIGLVAATILAVGLTAKWFFPELPWAVCFILGAVVSPTDTVASLAVIERISVLRRLRAILCGESLVNDGTGLVGVQIGVAVVLTGIFDAGGVALQFARVAGIGVLIGIACGVAFALVNRVVRNTSALFTLSLLAPYVAFHGADRLGCSGVLATVVAGFIAAWRFHMAPAASRVVLYQGWRLMTFVLNALCFVFIGIEVPHHAPSWSPETQQLLLGSLAVAAAAILTRMLWVYPGAYVPLWLSAGLRGREGGYPSWRAVTVAGWCGMRGAISLAAALALPTTTLDGSPFPGREELLFATMVVIGVTLLVQGLTLAPLIRFLRVPGDTQTEAEARTAWTSVLRAGIARLDRFCSERECPVAVHHLRQAMSDRLLSFESEDAAERGLAHKRLAVSREVREAVHEAQTAELLRLRDSGRIDDQISLRLQLALDSDLRAESQFEK
jgi:CPA1 family monovalent cation:H+ antiporter